MVRSSAGLSVVRLHVRPYSRVIAVPCGRRSSFRERRPFGDRITQRGLSMKNRVNNQHNIVIATPTPKSIGIVGGKGQMGKLLEREFRATGYMVRTSGKEDGVSERTLRMVNYHLLRESD